MVERDVAIHFFLVTLPIAYNCLLFERGQCGEIALNPSASMSGETYGAALLCTPTFCAHQPSVHTNYFTPL